MHAEPANVAAARATLEATPALLAASPGDWAQQPLHIAARDAAMVVYAYTSSEHYFRLAMVYGDRARGIHL